MIAWVSYSCHYPPMQIPTHQVLLSSLNPGIDLPLILLLTKTVIIMKKCIRLIAAFAVIASIGQRLDAQSDITQPGDPIVASSDNSPGSEGVANAIDNQPTKYLNFDKLDTGFTVSPQIGLTLVSGLTLTSANDAVPRDPASYKLEGSLDGSTFEVISEGDVGAFAERFESQTISFDNSNYYLHYRLTFPTVADEAGANSMQIAEVEILGVQGPTDVTQPGDALIASSDNSPGSEGVANAIDNQPTKYLNFDTLDTGFTVTPGVGGTIVTGLSLQSANDAPPRDPASYSLEGSLDGATFFEISSGEVPAFTDRFQTRYVFFENSRAFASYRLIFPTVADEGGANSMQVAEIEFLGRVAELPQDVTQPGDAIIASSDNSPGSEGVANVIDNQPTKYLNFDTLDTGFTVTPGVGITWVTGLTLQSANDAPPRDPATYLLEGSNDGGVTFSEISSGDVPPFAERFQTNTILFDNGTPYVTYRLTFPTVADEAGANSMQIAEVELLGISGPVDVTQPGDAIIASSDNSPGSEGVANAIDNQPTKYLNFDTLDTGFTVTPQIGATTVIGLSLQSANDAPPRDPASFTLEGSNDGGATFSAISEGTIPAFTDRFQMRYVFFANEAAYETYRLIFPTVADEAGANSMQIAEVELLAFAGGETPDVEITGLIRQQPTDAPALEGVGAQLAVVPAGPWKVQWEIKDPETGEFSPVAGATSPEFVTAPLDEDNSGSVYRARLSSPEGYELSNEVTASLFTPSETRSIAVNWIGSGANGAPTEMFPEDITGFHHQAYWNNTDVATGDLFVIYDPDPEDGETPVAVDSNNEEIEDITIEFQSNGEWGTGTGEGNPTQRMLNGHTTLPQNTRPISPALRIGQLPEGEEHSVLLYFLNRPLEFFEVNVEAVVFNDNGEEVSVGKRFIRPQNADEYNPSPGWILVSAETEESRAVGNMVRFDGIDGGEFGEVSIFIWAPNGGNVGMTGMQLLLDTVAPPPAPSFTSQPTSLNGFVGGSRILSVEVTEGSEIQWFKDGQPIPGATGAELVLPSLGAADAGVYTAAATNEGGRVVSKPAVVDVIENKDLQTGLTTHIKFDTDGGDPELELMNTADISRNGGIIDGALELDGIEGYGFVESYEQPEENFTLTVWAKSNIGLDSFAWGPIVRAWLPSRATGDEGQFLLEIREGLDSQLSLAPEAFGLIGVGPNVPSVASVISPDGGDDWHHYALSGNGNTLTLYVDGAAVGTKDYLGAINDSSFGWLTIGANLNETEGILDIDFNAFPPTWEGLIDDLAIFNRSLDQDEIMAIYDAGSEGTAVDEVVSPLPDGIEVELPEITGATLSEDGQSMIIEYVGELFSAPSLGDGFNPVEGASSPYTAPFDADAKFFLVK